jgi:hypothetical protein
MKRTQQVLAVHPAAPEVSPELLEPRAACIDACFDCAQACTSGADAWLDETDTADVRTCQRAQQNCAAVCLAAASILPRLGSPGTASGLAFFEALLGACRAGCLACAEQCAPHTAYQHCSLCRQVCLRCDQACGELLAALALARP